MEKESESEFKDKAIESTQSFKLLFNYIFNADKPRTYEYYQMLMEVMPLVIYGNNERENENPQERAIFARFISNDPEDDKYTLAWPLYQTILPKFSQNEITISNFKED